MRENKNRKHLEKRIVSAQGGIHECVFGAATDFQLRTKQRIGLRIIPKSNCQLKCHIFHRNSAHRRESTFILFINIAANSFEQFNMFTRV